MTSKVFRVQAANIIKEKKKEKEKKHPHWILFIDLFPLPLVFERLISDFRFAQASDSFGHEEASHQRGINMNDEWSQVFLCIPPQAVDKSQPN